MIIVIQCAASKRADAGHLTSGDGKPVSFVADPAAAPTDPDILYARPDDMSAPGVSWRQALLQYNCEPSGNTLGLYPAWQLYENKAYERLWSQLRPGNLYILSAGWGLIRADFLTPCYDITFSQSADPYKRRRKSARYQDLRMLPDETDEDVVFFGGKDYVPLFCSLTDSVRTRKTIFYNSATVPQVKGCAFERFETTTRTNWHYECVNAFLDGKLSLRPR